MPSKNIVKHFSPNAFYHVYNHAAESRIIFIDDQDYTVFLDILKRYVQDQPGGIERKSAIRVMAFCLMPRYFHLLLFQTDQHAVTDLMRKISTAYVLYFNHKYNLKGKLFRGTYRAALMVNQSQRKHVSRYIHRLPAVYNDWQWSSLKLFLGKQTADWVKSDEITGIMQANEYEYFINDDRGFQASLRFLKSTFADSE
jgi:REP element-mobilizing transposase RayT